MQFKKLNKHIRSIYHSYLLHVIIVLNHLWQGAPDSVGAVDVRAFVAYRNLLNVKFTRLPISLAFLPVTFGIECLCVD